MICKNCVYYDGEFCEIKFDEEGEFYKPDDVRYCKNFEACLTKYRQRPERKERGING